MFRSFLILAFLALSFTVVVCAVVLPPKPTFSQFQMEVLKASIPDDINTYLNEKIAPQSKRAKKVCTRVTFQRDAPNHYNGTVFFIDGTQTVIDLLDDGRGVHWKTEATSSWPSVGADIYPMS